MAAWLADALKADSASQVLLDEAVGAATGLAALGERIYDAVLVGHAPGELDAVEFVEGLRAAEPKNRSSSWGPKARPNCPPSAMRSAPMPTCACKPPPRERFSGPWLARSSGTN